MLGVEVAGEWGGRARGLGRLLVKTQFFISFEGEFGHLSTK